MSSVTPMTDDIYDVSLCAFKYDYIILHYFTSCLQASCFGYTPIMATLCGLLSTPGPQIENGDIFVLLSQSCFFSLILFFFARLELFAEKLSQKGCPLPNCFGFIDGTHIEG